MFNRQRQRPAQRMEITMKSVITPRIGSGTGDILSALCAEQLPTPCALSVATQHPMTTKTPPMIRTLLLSGAAIAAYALTTEPRAVSPAQPAAALLPLGCQRNWPIPCLPDANADEQE